MDKTFFDGVRPMFGGSLTQSQVNGFGAIKEAWDAHGDGDIRKLAYILATAKHETANTMQPVRETLAKTDAKAKEILTKAWRSGKLTWVKSDYWSGGYFGRGYVQLTHKANYQKAEDKLGYPFVANPSLALNDRLAAKILVRGCMEGWFTGRSLGDYINEDTCEFIGARRVVNGVDKNKLIAGYAGSFLTALEASPAPKPAAPVPASPEASSGRGWLSVLIGVVVGWLKAWLGRKS